MGIGHACNIRGFVEVSASRLADGGKIRNIPVSIKSENWSLSALGQMLLTEVRDRCQ